MTINDHISALPSHYDHAAQLYDQINAPNSEKHNEVLESILAQEGSKTVLDLTCGTGCQVFYLAKRGYTIAGVDINEKMLEKARAKAQEQGIALSLEQGDMRNTQLGQFDAVVTIFNAIGHLTKEDFNLTIKNVSANLIPGGLYIFDIFNLEFLLHKNNITQLTCDWPITKGAHALRKLQYSTISPEGVLTSYTLTHQNIPGDAPLISTSQQTLQVYTEADLRMLLKQNGFEVIKILDIDGTPFKQHDTQRMLLIARKGTS